VYSFILEANEERPEFIGGQYLTIRIPGFEPVEGKSYSISSRAQEPMVRLTIKEMGSFSRAILAHRIGDTLTTSAPYGFFYPEQDETTDLAFIAGGIGITPCLSIIETLLYAHSSRKISLLYSNRTMHDIIFKNELDALQQLFPSLDITYFVTREEVSEPHFVHGRMTASSILSSLQAPSLTDFFICGSIDFTKGLWSELKTGGVKSTQIYTEGFF